MADRDSDEACSDSQVAPHFTRDHVICIMPRPVSLPLSRLCVGALRRPQHTMSLADYLAKNYLTADSEKKSKKRKRKDKTGGLTIDDDENLGWKDKADEDDEDAPMISRSTAGNFCRALTNIIRSGRRTSQKVQEEVQRKQRCNMGNSGRRSTFTRTTTCRRRSRRRRDYSIDRCRPQASRRC